MRKGRVKLLEDLLISVKEARSNFEKPSEVLLVDDSKAEDVIAINEMCKKYDAKRIEFGPSVPEKRNIGAKKAQYTESELLEILNLERSTFYDRKKEAVMLLGIALWGYAIPVFRGIFDAEGDESEIPEFFTNTEKSDLCPTKVL